MENYTFQPKKMTIVTWNDTSSSESSVHIKIEHFKSIFHFIEENRNTFKRSEISSFRPNYTLRIQLHVHVVNYDLKHVNTINSNDMNSLSIIYYIVFFIK